MKITFLVYNIYGMGGTIRTVVTTANYFASKDYDVEIISVRKTRAKPMFDIDERVKLTPIFDARKGMLFGKHTPWYQKFIKQKLMNIPSWFIDKDENWYHMFNLFVDLKILAALRKVREGVLITTLPSFNVLSAKFVNKRVIKIGQEHLYFAGYGESLQKKIKKHYKKLDALTCLTDSEIHAYEKLLSGSPVKLYKLENATAIPEETAKLDQKVVIAAGRYVPEKGFDLLIPAFAKVSKKHPDWTLKIFGAGAEEEALREKILTEKASDHISLMPKTNNILGEMLNSSIYALSSRQESFGMVIIEAMSVGLPCVSFACAGPREVIKDKEDGLLVEEGNIDELAASLMKLIESPSLRKEYGRNAKKNVERYSLQVLGDKWEQALAEQIAIKAKQAK